MHWGKAKIEKVIEKKNKSTCKIGEEVCEKNRKESGLVSHKVMGKNCNEYHKHIQMLWWGWLNSNT